MADPHDNNEALQLVKRSFEEFVDDDCPRMAAALSYYTVFSLPPLLVLLIMLLGVFVDTESAQRQITSQIESLIGPEAGEEVGTMIENANRPGTGGPLPTILGLAALLFGATGAFAQLQAALNTAWEVAPDPKKSGRLAFLVKRVLSLGMILTVAFLLLVSLALSALLSAIGGQLSAVLPGGLGQVFGIVLDLIISLAIITLLFAAIFKWLPDAEIRWKDVWVGAFVTSALFVIGKFAIGFYLGRSDPGSAYGAAGSLAVILIWIYYSAMIVFLGAEFTQVWAKRHGEGIRPDEDAVRVVEETVHDRAHQDDPPDDAPAREPV